MKKLNIIILSISLIGLLSNCKSYVIFKTSEKDAEIYINGTLKGKGVTEAVKLSKNQCVSISASKTGFFPYTSKYCYARNNSSDAPIVYPIDLINDDAYDASILTDYANKDFDVVINPKFSEEEAWKIISQVVTGYFDNLELTDKATGYLKTTWQTKSFTKKTIRTRIVVKQGNISPLKYKVKIISEEAVGSNQSVKDDDKFKEWDRILRVYEPLISEFQARLGGSK
ncbi:MAG: hypothetical protein WC319_05975 [Candidatus Paceibacterota bacterium]|jgi:Fe-S cluster assembly iron-binding protein IscA